MISLQIWKRMRIVHNFKFTGFVFFICMQESCCLGPCFFKIIFAPFVEIDVWYKFVHNLLISERISNITRHKCSELSALQYHKSDSRYQSNDLTPYIQSGPRRRAVQHFVFQSRISQHVYLCRSADGYVANFLRFDKSWLVCRYDNECESFTISNSQVLLSSFACRNLVAWDYAFLNYFCTICRNWCLV